MRMRTWLFMLSALTGLGAAGCFPDYSFDLTETDDVDAGEADSSADAGDATATDADTAADADDGAATDADTAADAGDDAEADSGTSADAGDDAATDSGTSADAGDDAATDSGTSADAGDAGTDSGGGFEPPEPNCGEGALNAEFYECVSPPPTGWSGPVALFNEVVGVPVPPCPALFTQEPVYDGHKDLNPTAASCSKCTCSNVKGVTCTIPEEESYSSSATCSGCGWVGGGSGPEQRWNECFGWRFEKPTGCDAPRSVKLGPSTPTKLGTCTPSTQSPVIPPAFSDNARACHAPSSSLGCDGGLVCAPKLDDDYRQMCIIRIGTGEASCPAGPYSEKRVFYRGATDTRGCTSCQCGGPTDVQCNAVLKTYSNARSCTNEDGSVPADSCGSFPPAIDNPDNSGEWVKSFSFESNPTGTCAPSGGQPTGTVEASGTVQTICCML